MIFLLVVVVTVMMLPLLLRAAAAAATATVEATLPLVTCVVARTLCAIKRNMINYYSSVVLNDKWDVIIDRKK